MLESPSQNPSGPKGWPWNRRFVDVSCSSMGEIWCQKLPHSSVCAWIYLFCNTHHIFLFIASQFLIIQKFTVCVLFILWHLLFVLSFFFPSLKTGFIQLPRLHSFSDWVPVMCLWPWGLWYHHVPGLSRSLLSSFTPTLLGNSRSQTQNNDLFAITIVA